MINQLSIRNFGPIDRGTVEFGDLTVLVGPQASGKSLFLQLYRFLEDAEAIYTFARNNNMNWRMLPKKSRVELFSTLYFGGGMQTLWSSDKKPEIKTNGEVCDFVQLVSQPSETKRHSVFLVPAQRTLAFQDGWPRPFSQYAIGTPFSLSFFSDVLWNLLDRDFAGTSNKLFPLANRLKQQFRTNIAQSIYWKYHIQIRKNQRTGAKGIQLCADTKEDGLVYSAWSSGQREFTPLLLGCYHLMPAGGNSKKDDINTIIIEEPEMGLHPQAIISFFQLVLELLRRGYRVILSTHSNIILDLTWALVKLQHLYPGREKKIYSVFTKAFSLKKSQPVWEIFEAIMGKTFKTYSFNHQPDGVQIQDISSLDPGSEDTNISGWGGVTGISGQITDAVGEAFAQTEND